MNDINLMAEAEEVVIPSMKTQVGLGNCNDTADSDKNVLSATKWTTARKLAIGSSAKQINGTSDVTFTLAEIGTIGTSDIKKLISDSNTALMQSLYPIGSVKITFTNINPGTIIPNTTWELTSKGMYLRGVDPGDTSLNTVKTGGSNTINTGHTHYIDAHNHTVDHTHTINAHTHSVYGHTHTTGGHVLTVSEMPVHNHGVAVNDGQMSFVGGGAPASNTFDAGITCDGHSYRSGKTISIVANGGGAAHSHGSTGISASGTDPIALTTNSGGGYSSGTALDTRAGGGIIDIQPVYQTLYIWKRTK